MIDNELIIDVWDLVKGYCVSKKRDELAHRLLHIYEDHGADADQFDLMIGEDHNLDNAINEWISEHSADEDEEDEDGYITYYEEDDEE